MARTQSSTADKSRASSSFTNPSRYHMVHGPLPLSFTAMRMPVLSPSVTKLSATARLPGRGCCSCQRRHWHRCHDQCSTLHTCPIERAALRANVARLSTDCGVDVPSLVQLLVCDILAATSIKACELLEGSCHIRFVAAKTPTAHSSGPARGSQSERGV